jgi:hypothetical protein
MSDAVSLADTSRSADLRPWETRSSCGQPATPTHRLETSSERRWPRTLCLVRITHCTPHIALSPQICGPPQSLRGTLINAASVEAKEDPAPRSHGHGHRRGAIARQPVETANGGTRMEGAKGWVVLHKIQRSWSFRIIGPNNCSCME